LLRKANIEETDGNTVGASVARPLKFDEIMTDNRWLPLQTKPKQHRRGGYQPPV